MPMMRIVVPMIVAAMGIVEAFVLTQIGRARAMPGLIIAGIAGGVLSLVIALVLYVALDKARM